MSGKPPQGEPNPNPNPNPNAPPPRRAATVLESVEEVRALVRASAAGGHTLPEFPGLAGGPRPPAPTPTEPVLAPARPFRPAVRPPMGLLHVFDDGDEAAEVFRVRSSPFVIGRVEGDLVLPHDPGVSGRHAEIVRRVEGGAVTWWLCDLGSTNGTFARAAVVHLHHDQELLIGATLFRFDAPSPPPPAAGPAPSASPAPAAVTGKWGVPNLGAAAAARPAAAVVPPPALVEVARGGGTRRHVLTGDEVWLGRDRASCGIAVDDPAVDPRHARLTRDPRTGRWSIANHQSLNGLWGRVREVALGRGGFFQCGEQRFLFRAL